MIREFDESSNYSDKSKESSENDKKMKEKKKIITMKMNMKMW